jgi:ribosome-associated heat shock protein Hsp15
VNGSRAENPARAIGIGDVVTVAAPHATLAVRVLGLGVRRGPAPEARLLYDDLSGGGPPVETHE